MSAEAELDVDWYETDEPHQDTEPKLTIYSGLDGYINSPADREWFGDAERIDIGTVEDEHLLVFKATENGRYKLSRQNNKRHGADVHITSVIKRVWGDPGLEDTQHAPMHKQGDLIVADLSEILGDDGEKVGTEEPESDVECEDCGEPFKNERGLSIHQGRSDECGESDGVDEQSSVDGVARVLQAVDEVETLQELADEIGETEGRARTLAKKAGCYSQLQEKPERPGVSRDG